MDGGRVEIQGGTVTGEDPGLALLEGTASTGDGSATAKPVADKLLAGKYKTPEDLEKGYLALQQKLGNGTDTPTTPPIGNAGLSLEDAGKGDKGFSLESYGIEVAEKGELSAKSQKELEKRGLSSSDVDAYLRGQKAIVAERQAEFSKIAGSEEEFTAVREWAKENLEPGQKEAYQKALKAGDYDTAKLVLRGIVAEYRGAVPVEPSLLGGESARRSGGDVKGFGTSTEMTNAINDKRYGVDEAYTVAVQNRILSSKLVSGSAF